MSRLNIVRGLPGSGKTTFAKKFSCLHLEADMFFMHKGEYKWEAKQIKKAHQWCQGMVFLALSNNIDVVVANTFTTLKEMKPYLDSPLYDDILVYKATGDYGSIHDVPEDVIRKMEARWEDYEGEEILI